MRFPRTFLPLALVGLAVSCGSIPSETAPLPLGNELAPSGVLRGSVIYSGPHPCSQNGHIVGAAILFVFDRRLLPPPSGLGSTPVNFAAIVGDVLFANEPRNPGSDVYCPKDHGVTDTITVNAPFVIPVSAGSYVIQAFYDYTGDFLPNFGFRDLPELGDVAGGDVDTAAALNPMNAGNLNFVPPFIPINVGIPEALPDGEPPGDIPNFTMPPQGYVADNLTVTIGAVFQTTRPYFYPGGMKTSFDPGSGGLTQTEVQNSAAPPTSLVNIKSTVEKNLNFDPVLTIPQDIQVLAGPTSTMPTEADVNNFESKFPRLVLHAGLPGKVEPPKAIAAPFKFQLPPSGMTSSFNVWQNASFDSTKQKWVPQDVAGQPIPQLWPLVILTKLIDDPGHKIDPASTTPQGGDTAPAVVIQGITLLGGDGTVATNPDSIFNTGQAEQFGDLFDPGSGQPVVFTQDHLTVLLQPAVICFDTLFDSTQSDKRGTIVLPHPTAMSADLSQPAVPNQPILPPSVLMSPQISSLVSGVKQGCLPTGRYAINLVYPNGQAWTVPNESGACAGDEGSTNYSKLDCTIKPRPILYSQGTRAVVEVVPATNPAHCTGATKVPAICLPYPQ